MQYNAHDDKVKKSESKSNKKKYIICICILSLAIVVLCIDIVKRQKEKSGLTEERQLQDKIDEETRTARKNETIKDIKSHYANSVIVTEDTNLLDNSGNTIGTIYKDSIINLGEADIDENTKYFSIGGLNYRIDYNSVTPHDPIITGKLSKENRYKKYIPYNKNIVTKDAYSLYYNGKKVYTFNRSDTYPIIIKDYDDYYYVEFDNRLYGINKNDIKEIIDANNSTTKNKSYITTLCYHRIYGQEKCTDSALCIKQETFDTQMKYLKDNNYLTLTMEEMYLYINDSLQIEKGVLVTLDDGWLLSSAVEVFDKYDLNGVSFAYTNHIDGIVSALGDSAKSENFEFQSHTHNLHRNWVCSKSLSKIGSSSQGGAILCESEENITTDLKKSITILESLGKSKVIGLAYPFYDFNDRAIKLIKTTGLKLAFTGTYGKKGRATVGTNPYIVPRIPIRQKTDFNTWKSYL